MSIVSQDSIRKPIIDQKPIMFKPSPRTSLGIEIEMILVDPETGHMVPRSGELMDALGEEALDWCKHELFQGIVEVISKKCENIEEARADLSWKMKHVFATADKLGIGLIGAGTHPFSNWADQPITDMERYNNFIKRMGWTARRLMITGLHVHVGLDSGEKAVAIMNSLCAFIPHVLALTASSPYWQGIDTLLASARLKVFELLPTAGLPPRVTNWMELVRLMRTLMAAEAITSIREIWWDVRPHHGLGTIEVRIMDNPSSPTEVLAAAAFVQALVAYLGDLYDQGAALPELSLWTLRENKWRAVRYGENALLIRNEKGEICPLKEHAAGIIQDIYPFAVNLGCAPYFQVVEAILRDGPGYVRQRNFIEKGGTMPDLVKDLIRQYRNDEPYGGLIKGVPKFYD